VIANSLDKFCDVLAEAGVTHLFGVPGGNVYPIMRAFDKRKQGRIVLTRHEHAASCMADMYARLTRKPAVVIGQGPFAGSSGVFGVIEAFISGTPMLVVTDAINALFPQQGLAQSGTGEYGTFDLRAILKASCKFVTYPTRPRELVQGLQLAIKHATTPRFGPAAVVLHSPRVWGEFDTESPPRLFPTEGYLANPKTTPDDDAVTEALELLSASKRPALIAGNGVHWARAYDELLALAERLGAPVATSLKGKGTIPETHPLAVGVLGEYGQEAANRAVAGSDLILSVGCHLGPSDTCFGTARLIDPERQKIVQIDNEPHRAGWTVPITAALIGDAVIVLRRLVERLPGRADQEESRRRVESLKREERYFQGPGYDSDARPILPQRLVRVLNDVLDPSAIVTLDAGSNRIWMTHGFAVKEVGTFFAPGGTLGMGWGPPAAVAAKIVQPDRTCVSVSGDGGFAMSAHAVSKHAPVIFVVMNDSALGMVATVQGRHKTASLFPETDFAKIGEGFGGRGVVVDTVGGFEEALREAQATDLPTVIDVRIDRDENYQSIISSFAARYQERGHADRREDEVQSV
jgi:acetolactate synthase-1/2/3 large subunit